METEDDISDFSLCCLCHRTFEICLENTFESSQEVFNSCSKYFKEEIIKPDDVGQHEEKSGQFCWDCFKNAEKLCEMEKEIKKMRTRLRRFLKTFKNEILFRSKEYNAEINRRFVVKEEIEDMSSSDEDIKMEQVEEANMKTEIDQDIDDPDSKTGRGSLHFSDSENEETLASRKQSNNNGTIRKESLPEGKRSIASFRSTLIHKKVRESQSCTTCSLTFSSERRLNKHIKLHHPEDMKIICEICGKICTSRKAYSKHNRCHIESSLECDECHEVLTSKRLLTIHYIRVHGRKFSNHVDCTVCGESITKTCLEKHLRMHKDEKLPCKECGKEFTDSRYLATHIKMAHTEKDLWNCETCGQSFTCLNGFKSHMKNPISHMNRTCPECGKTFRNNGGFRAHMEAHKGKRTYNYKEGVRPGRKKKVQ